MGGQLSLFDEIFDQSTHASLVKWVLYVDGASRGNPGPAGVGIYVTRDGAAFVKQGYFLGTATNNQAEYMALLLGLCQIKSHIMGNYTLHIISDSELLVRQVSGTYAVKHTILKHLHAQVMAYLRDMRYTIAHVLRAENSVADSLANEGIDHKRAIPDTLRRMCSLPLND